MMAVSSGNSAASVVRAVDPARKQWLPHRAMGLARLVCDPSGCELPIAIRAQARHGRVERDAIDPRREGRVASEGPDLAVHLHQHVLGHLFGIGRVAHVTQGQLVNTWSKSLCQLLHGGLVSRLEPAYQLTVNAPVHGVLVYVQKNTDRFGLIPVLVTCSFG